MEHRKFFVKDVPKLIPISMELFLYLYDTKTKESLYINENKKFPLASIAKWIVGSIVF
ncbi:hypothetical protein AB1283_04425 [Bacillus sp. S13(2024)]|uniref:hypothetical protein n=1 Tax=unclassified Bacillus (in: firmicutes) TaxID=185979 RepID=UPI003D244F85